MIFKHGEYFFMLYNALKITLLGEYSIYYPDINIRNKKHNP